mmetsp:Transcript_146332/g.270065  ORF Transcript_146332/g.270065 Transcript_146332/m.270065 type:complete len:212 (+) Transcript_146332:428-1063(+)
MTWILPFRTSQLGSFHFTFFVPDVRGIFSGSLDADNLLRTVLRISPDKVTGALAVTVLSETSGAICSVTKSRKFFGFRRIWCFTRDLMASHMHPVTKRSSWRTRVGKQIVLGELPVASICLFRSMSTDSAKKAWSMFFSRSGTVFNPRTDPNFACSNGFSSSSCSSSSSSPSAGFSVTVSFTSRARLQKPGSIRCNGERPRKGQMVERNSK